MMIIKKVLAKLDEFCARLSGIKNYHCDPETGCGYVENQPVLVCPNLIIGDENK